ncbi:MAG: GNAT family N-acetyltransferase [Erythrobacter sp.]|nr:GNAT family N-acetyltransferase [Erythrobacter sp.]
MDIARFDPDAKQRSEEIALDCMLVAQANDRAVGYIAWKPRGFVEFDYITYLFVDPAARRCGIASRLFDAALAKLDRRRVFTSTQMDNEIMLALLPNSGWQMAGTVEMANEDDSPEIFFFKERVG